VVRKRRKGIYILPNLFTLAALFGGFYAIVMAMNGRFDMAASASSAPWCSTAWTAAWPA
jgi:CDP-diacylglycerol--serine O-phosphatidyltransferase